MIPASDPAAVMTHVTEQIAEARAWADSTIGQLAVAVVYGGISAEDQLYISKSPPDQLSVTALSQVLAQLGVRYEVLDPCRASFVRDLARFDVVLPNLHGPFGETAACKGCWTTSACRTAAAASPRPRSPPTRSCAST